MFMSFNHLGDLLSNGFFLPNPIIIGTPDGFLLFNPVSVQNSGITITSRGHEMARLVPVEDRMGKSREILRKLGKNAFIGDILSPVNEKWEAMK
jgi:hypothetical protein